MKKLLALFAASLMAVCCFGFAGCNKTKPVTLDSIKQKGTLIVATNSDFKPFEYVNDGKVVGIDMDMADYIAKKLSAHLGKTIKLEIRDMDFDSVVISTKNSTDIAMAGLTVDAERAKTVDFTQSYYDATQLLVVNKNDTTFDACTTAEEAEAIITEMGANAKIGYQNGTTGQLYANGNEDWNYEGFAAAKKTGYPGAPLAATDMKNGNINMVVVDEEPAKSIVAANPNDFKLINIVLTQEKYAIGVRKGSKELVDFINQCLEDMKSDGTYDQILAKYIVSDNA